MDLHTAGGRADGMVGYTLCSTPESPVWGQDQGAIDDAYEMFLSDTYIDIATLPPCGECLRVAELLTDPDTAPPLHHSIWPEVEARSTGDGIRGLLNTDIVTGAPNGRRAAVHLLTFTSVPDQPGFGDLVRVVQVEWDWGDDVLMGWVTDWAAVIDFAAAAGVPDRDRQMIAVAASLDGGPPVSLESAVVFVGDPAAARRVIEAVAIATGHGDRWELTERSTPSTHT
ncbi:hypothetical protein [Micromonospora sp. NBRC 101691]|uniref:hypothetical protein n=1 Tax=Micromonospora sp. NBRC 101691 TaxID=3032198 RepID=UPI00249FE386|nr:hypothetical protein [Micromonospora sp. NBRC 101691]GLY24144.1 hypothetical protein Misp04_38760 [Micromonospora sp. NBRC 101691]